MSMQESADNKRIVLCSDGTGNQEGKNNGTNVFKTYLAVNRCAPAEHDTEIDDPAERPSKLQVAFYDNGVGTEKNKIARAIGGAFGIGFAKNIKDLYEYLAFTYEPGDLVYLFGFSRGAATVRAFSDFVHKCGLLDVKTTALGREEARAEIEKIFAAYRNQDRKKIPGNLTIQEHREKNLAVSIEFLGVWDTVSALGFPRDLGAIVTCIEWVANKLAPHRFYDYELNDSVRHAYHALSIDDERESFAPMVYREVGSCRVEQVWFPGVHSNVGGGYPREGLSYLALDWMMEKAHDHGLEFQAADRIRAREKADSSGKQYDSRAGLALYYRYLPRDIQALHGDNKSRIRIHESVLTRMQLGAGGYAPGNLPADFVFVDNAGHESDLSEQRRQSYCQIAHSARGTVNDRKRLHRVFFYLSAIAALVTLYVGWAQWQQHLQPAVYQQITGAIAGLLIVLMLRPQLNKLVFGAALLGIAVPAGASIGAWIEGIRDTWFVAVLTFLADAATWILPVSLEPLAYLMIVDHIGVTGAVCAGLVWLLLKHEDLQSKCASKFERARQSLLFAEGAHQLFSSDMWLRRRRRSRKA